MKRLLFVPLLLLLLLIPAGVVMAQGDETVVDESIANDVVIFDQDLSVTENGRINGDVFIWNGSATIAGLVRGDIAIVNGNLELAETAVLRGECVVVNGEIVGDNTANCTVVTGLPQLPGGLTNLIGGAAAANPPAPPIMHHTGHLWWQFTQVAGRTLLFGILAFLAASLLPAHLRRIQGAVEERPLASGVVGFLTGISIPVLVILLIPVSVILLFVCIGILGFPLMFALIAGLIAAATLGWIVMGNMVGVWLAERLNLNNRSLATTASLGAMALTLGLGLLGLIPSMPGDEIISFFVACVGLGAVALTKFGTRAYPVTAVTPDDEKVTAVLKTLPNE